MELYSLIAPNQAETSTPNQQLTVDDFKLDWDEKIDAFEEDEMFTPPSILRVLDDSRYYDFNPILERSLLISDTYSATYKSLLDYTDTIIDNFSADFP